jgi:hypothetical protein
MPLIRFTSYGLDRMAERGITEDEVRQVLAQPEQVQVDPGPGRVRAYGRWPARDRLYLRVVYVDEPALGVRWIINAIPPPERRLPR